jgi:hypothetical protein
MNPNESTTPLPFFLQYLEPQFAEDTDTLSAGGGNCIGYQQTRLPSGCVFDSLKYPSDHDEQR